MSSETDELIRICQALPVGKRAAVADFAKYLLDQEDDNAWEQIITDAHHRPKLDEFVRAALAEGSEELDVNRRDLSRHALISSYALDT